MKLMLLADLNSSHIIKWATSLSSQGFDLLLFGLGDIRVRSYEKFSNIRIKTVDVEITRQEGSFKKVFYLRAFPLIKKIIREYKPDILHSHYASSYGLLGALTGFRPFIVSVWGSDIYSFPEKSFLHKKIIKFVLSRADVICSTSYTMGKRTKLFTDKDIKVVPFGVDTKIFRPTQVKSLFDEKDIVIGTVKTLEEKYGIEYLIKAFKIVSDKHKNLPLKLLIVGGGSLEEKLKELSRDLGIWDKITFIGKVPFEEVPKYYNMLSVSVSVSESESFGVAVVEAMACGKPVVVSSVGGLPEVVEDGKTGFVVPPRNPEETAKAIEKLVLDKELRIKMGNAGRERVKRLYDWNKCVEKMINIYKEVLNK